MDNTFDFRISQPACVEALEVYKSVEAILENEREKQKQNIQTLKPNWSGQSAETYAEKMEQFLDNGEYNHTYNKVKGMRQLLEEVLPEVNALLVRCEGFADQLESDEYVEPVRPAIGDNTIRNGGILSLNYAMINVIVNRCYEIEENRALTNTLKSIVYDCEGLIEDTESDLSAIEAASKKVNRIANFRESFQKYAMGIRNLEYEMNLQLCRLAEDTCGLSQKVGISQTELESGEMDKADIYNLSYMAETELTALMEQCIEDDDIETMKCVAGQIFAKDSSQWSAAEAMFIAQTLNHALEKGELEIVELYTGNMLTATYTEPTLIREQTQYMAALYSSQYVVKPDVAKIELIMGNLNAKENGLTYYTLNRIANMETESITIHSYSSIKQECGTYHVETQKILGKIQLVFCASIPNEYVPTFGDADREITMTAYDMGKIIPVGILADRGLSEAEAERLRLSVINDTDVAFMEKLASKQYAEMFDISPDKLSDLTGEGLTDYILLLEAHHQTDEIEDVVNAVLKTDREHNMILGDVRGQYITLICDNLINEISDLNDKTLQVKDDNVLINALSEKGEKTYMQYGLWKAVGHIYNYEFGLSDMGEVAYDFKYGLCHAEISELIPGEDNMYDFQFRIAGAEFVTDELDGKIIDVNMEKVVDEFYFGELENIEIKGLEEQKKEVAKNAIIDGMIGLSKMALPAPEFIYPIVEVLLDDDFSDAVVDEVDLLYARYEEQTEDALRVDADEFGAVVEAFFAYDKLNEQIEAKKNLLKNVMFSQAIDIDFYLENEVSAESESKEKIKIESQLVTEGVILPRTTYNVSRFSDAGIVAMLADMGKSSEEIEKIQAELEREFDSYANFEYVINGGNISQIPSDELFDYMEDLNGFMEEKGYGKCDIFSWFRGEKMQ